MSSLFEFLKRKEPLRMYPSVYKNNLLQGIQMVLIDVRTQEEFDERHIDGATLLPLHLLEQKAEIVFPDKDKTYVIYCRSGIRSYNALLLMKQLGYKAVFDMGGINDWPYEVIR